MIEIRPYQQGDRERVIALWTDVLPSSARHNDPAASLDQKLAVDPELLLVAVVDAGVVGTAMGGYDGHRGWIYSIAVDRAHRRRGVGRELVRRLEAALIDRGCLKVNLQVRVTNAATVAFYERVGYSVEQLISMGKRLY